MYSIPRTDHMQTELSTENAAVSPPHYQAESSSNQCTAPRYKETTEASDQLRDATQRVRTVRIITRMHPDNLIPYLYSERNTRSSINGIVHKTGCTIDYCAVSPNGRDGVPPSRRPYVMIFLVAAASSETLEDAMQQLRTLVETVQDYVEHKTRNRYRVDERKGSAETKHASRQYNEVLPLDRQRRKERVEANWTEHEAGQGEEVCREMPFRNQRVERGSSRVHGCRERPRFMEVVDRKMDGKKEFRRALPSGKHTARGVDERYIQQQQGQSFHDFGSRRCMRYPEYSRWTRRYDVGPMWRKAGSTMYDFASSREKNEASQRTGRMRQPYHMYQRGPRHFAPPDDDSPCEYDEPRHEHNAAFSAYSATGNLANESAESDEGFEFVDQYQSMHRPHSRRTPKRPLSNMQSDRPSPPLIYRHRMPYIYDYMYDDEDSDWMTEDEEMDVGYEYPPQYRHVEIPVARRRRHFDSINTQQRWSSPAGHTSQHMYKRRRASREERSLDNTMADDAALEMRNCRHSSPPPPDIHAVVVGQLDEVADNAGIDAFVGHMDNFEQIDAERGSPPQSPSVSHTGNVGLDLEAISSFANEAALQVAGEASVSTNVNKDLTSLPKEMLSEAHDASGNKDELTSDNATADDVVGHASQSDVSALDLNGLVEETTAQVSLERPTTPTNSPTRKTTESRDASSSLSVVTTTDHNVSGTVANATEVSSERRKDKQANFVDAEVSCEKESSDEVFAFSDFTVHHDCALTEEKLTEPTADDIVTDTIRINNHAAASLERLNKVEASFVIAKTLLSAQESKLHQVEMSSKSCRRLEMLCGIVYDLECHLGSYSCGLDASRKQDLLDKLDNCLDTLSTQSEQILQEKVDALQTGLEHVVAVYGSFINDRAVESKTEAVKLNSCTLNSNTMSPIYSEMHDDKCNDTNDVVWEGDDWFQEAGETPVNPTNESDEQQQQFVAQVSSGTCNLNIVNDFPLHRWPRELPPFILSLLERVQSSGPQSYVMRVTLRRLLDEIAKADPYYYLYSTTVTKVADVEAPLHASPLPGCEFGCRGASALKWERKLVSQISSRIKSFDNVAYSLARSSRNSGSKEMLNRKKMNSIIRKLHLVAMQLHSLVSHLYCKRGHAPCKEVDSLAVALNNSHFERKMIVYKSRLKLVVPPKHQQQTLKEQYTVNEPADELVRDTYEFFPELLLCIDIWGYNYRESLVKWHNSNNFAGNNLAGLGPNSEAALFPLRYFRSVECLAFDFEDDSNGLLHCICDELLNIVCLWNDFNWTDGFEAVAIERVMTFESKMTASILKIFKLYSQHLQALWSAHLLDEPEQLRSIHFTEFNAYYSDRSQGSLNTTACSQSRAPGMLESHKNGCNCDSRSVGQHVTPEEMLEERLVEEYWNRKVTSLSILNPDDDAMEVDHSNSQLLSIEAISSWDQCTLVSYLLRWSDVYAIRAEVNALSAVTNHMMKREVQRFRFEARDDASVTSSSNVNKMTVDSSSRQLLAAVSRAQMLVRDALTGSEKLALHSASNQLLNEKRYSNPAAVEVSKPGNEISSSGIKHAPSCPTLASMNDIDVHSDDAALETVSHGKVLASKDVDSDDVIEDETIVTGTTAEKPELKDLIQVLAVTKEDMMELCRHRPRSARMREKIQMQSLQLARQTVEMFRNIKNMYASQ